MHEDTFLHDDYRRILEVTTRSFFVPGLWRDRLSVKSLALQGYQVIHDADTEE
jgi:hypothetical protein